MRRLLTAICIVLALIMVGLVGNANANMILNGSFESGPALLDAVGLYQNVYPPSTEIDNWTVITSNINYIGGYWQHSDGERSLDLNGQDGGGGVEQSFATNIGQEYTVNFDMSGNPSTHPDNITPIKWMRVLAAGDSADFSFDITGQSFGDMGWVTKSWSFVAIDTTTTLQFISLDNTSLRWGPALDNVEVVPEPTTLALLGIGGLALALRRHRG